MMAFNCSCVHNLFGRGGILGHLNMNNQQQRKLGENVIYDSLNGNHALNADEKEAPEGIDGRTNHPFFLSAFPNIHTEHLFLFATSILSKNFDLFIGNIQPLVEWLNHMIPHLNLPLEASEEELRACLIDGTVLCSILSKLNPGLVEMVGLLFP